MSNSAWPNSKVGNMLLNKGKHKYLIEKYTINLIQIFCKLPYINETCERQPEKSQDQTEDDKKIGKISYKLFFLLLLLLLLLINPQTQALIDKNIVAGPRFLGLLQFTAKIIIIQSM